MLSGDNGIITRTADAKEKTDTAQIQERVRLAYSSALARDLTNGNGDLTKPTLDEEINKEFGSSGKVEKDGDEWVIYVNDNEIERISIPESALKPTLISQGAKVGDYVNYNAASGNGANLQITASDIATIVSTADSTNGGATISGIFTSNDITKWRIISTENGIIKLMGEVPTTQTVTLKGIDGFKKSIQVLDKISSIFGKGNGATESKSITLYDIDLNNNLSWYTGEQEYSNGKFFKQILDNGKVVGFESNITEATENDTISMKTFCFGAGGPPLFNATNQNIWWEMLQSFSANSGSWIATRGNSCNTDVAGFGMFKAFSNGIMMDYLFNSDDSPLSDCTHFVQPVVTLKLDIRGEKAQDGSWNLDV